MIKRKRREPLVKPLRHGRVERALAGREAALAAPPEDGRGRHGGGREAEDFDFVALEPVGWG